MNNLERIEIDKLLETRPELKSDMLYSRDSEFIREVLTMPEWENDKFKHLLTSNIWFSNICDIKEILAMDFWDNPKFKHLLTPSIWNSTASEVREILSMPEWKDPRFLGLLTANIWQSNADDEKQCLQSGEAQRAYREGVISSFDGEMGEIILGKKVGRSSDQDITIFDSTGLFIQDLATSMELLEKANEIGIGVEVEI